MRYLFQANSEVRNTGWLVELSWALPGPPRGLLRSAQTICARSDIVGRRLFRGRRRWRWCPGGNKETCACSWGIPCYNRACRARAMPKFESQSFLGYPVWTQTSLKLILIELDHSEHKLSQTASTLHIVPQQNRRNLSPPSTHFNILLIIFTAHKRVLFLIRTHSLD